MNRPVNTQKHNTHTLSGSFRDNSTGVAHVPSHPLEYLSATSTRRLAIEKLLFRTPRQEPGRTDPATLFNPQQGEFCWLIGYTRCVVEV